MFKKMLAKAGAKTARKEQEAFLDLMRVGSDEEMATSLASAAVARFILQDPEDETSLPFPDAVFLGQRVIDEDAIAGLVLYNIRLSLQRKSALRHPAPGFQFLAAGFGIYMFSFRSLIRPELFPLGRMIWRELLRGADGYMEAMSLYAHKLSEEQAIALFPAPNVLAPG